MEDLIALVDNLRKYPNETTWIEFKHNNYDPEMIGKDISALANSAVLEDRPYSYMIWGIHDKTHELIGTDKDLQNLKKGNQELESWLRLMLSKNADFEFSTIVIEGFKIGILKIGKAFIHPVSFEKNEYIRIGSYTKMLRDYPTVQTQLWDRIRNTNFEEQYAKIDLNLTTALQLLDYSSYFDITNIPMPTDEKGIAHYMIEESLVIKQDNGKYAISNLGAITLAKRLSDFNKLARKAVRIIQYEGNNKLQILKEETIEKGYASGFKDIIKYMEAILPSREDISDSFREKKTAYPMIAVRELIANALIHQDFSITGTGPTIEVFGNRVEITNPGSSLVDIMRIIDNPPRSRNEKLAAIMRRLRLCEELGTGWDKITLACESMMLPAPKITKYNENTRVTLFSHIPYSKISKDDKLWACYLHACIMHTQGEFLTNYSLRKRFGLPDTCSGSISRLIKEATNKGYIKAFDDSASNKHMQYIPVWA